MRPIIYAELLRNLKQVSIFVDIGSQPNNTTLLELQDNGALLHLHHDKWDLTLSLPAAVRLIGPSQLAIPPGKSEWSKSLPILHQSSAIEGQNYVPWLAPQLNAGGCGFQCSSCSHEVVKPTTIKTWKDLPSHNWAEMMDFWHCHKPHTHHTDGSVERVKIRESNRKGIWGYSAEEGVGLVDLIFILLNERDCPGGVRRDDWEKSLVGDQQPVYCKNCGKQLGSGEIGKKSENEFVQKTWKLNKWNLCLISTTDSSGRDSYPAECFLSAQLMSIIDDQAVRRFRLLTESEDKRRISDPSVGLRLWVFHTDRTYNSSVHQTKPNAIEMKSIRAMKVFYLTGTQPDDLPPGGLEEEIVIADDCMSAVIRTLEDSTNSLPTSMRQFRCWKVGMLPRFEPGI